MKLAQTAYLVDDRIRLFNPRMLRRLDFGLIVVVATLAVAGVLALYSANRSVSAATPYFQKQLIFFLAGCGVALFVACLDHRFLVSAGPYLYAFFIVLLLAVLAFGTTVKGGQRWLEFGPFRIQPSEQTKLALILMLAWYFDLIGRRVERLPFFILAFVIAGIPALLIFKQPNLGTALALGPIVLAMLYAAGCRHRHLMALVVIAAISGPVAWKQLEEYQKDRVRAVFNPSADAQGSGYHTIQSMITVGSGGMTGKGYREGTQTYLSYLPEHHTDFIFSQLAEEMGFVGAAGILLLFLILFLRALSFARGSEEFAGSLVVVGIVAMLGFHVFVNVAITMGIMPVTGIPLPFLSYGGSFYLTTMLCMGVLLGVNARRGLFSFSQPRF